MLRILLYAIIIFILIIIYKLILYIEKKSIKKMDENNIVLHQSYFLFILGIICVPIFSIALFYNYKTFGFWGNLLFILLIISGVFLIIYSVRWKLQIENNKIIFRPFIGKKKIFNINYITRIELILNKLIAYNDNNIIFSIECNCIGFNIFFSRLEKENINIEIK